MSATTPGAPLSDLDIREKLARIDQLGADADRKRQELRLAPWQLVLAGATAGAAFFAAGAGFLALILRVTGRLP